MGAAQLAVLKQLREIKGLAKTEPRHFSTRRLISEEQNIARSRPTPTLST